MACRRDWSQAQTLPLYAVSHITLCVCLLASAVRGYMVPCCNHRSSTSHSADEVVRICRPSRASLVRCAVCRQAHCIYPLQMQKAADGSYCRLTRAGITTSLRIGRIWLQSMYPLACVFNASEVHTQAICRWSDAHAQDNSQHSGHEADVIGTRHRCRS